jgi:hypothetical protein
VRTVLLRSRCVHYVEPIGRNRRAGISGFDGVCEVATKRPEQRYATMQQDALVIALLIGSGFIAGFVFGYGVRRNLRQ